MYTEQTDLFCQVVFNCIWLLLNIWNTVTENINIQTSSNTFLYSVIYCRGSYLLAASCTCGAACSTRRDENCSNNILTASEFPNGLSGSITLLMNTLTMLSGLSWSGWAGPPISFSPSFASNDCWKHGSKTYCII